VFFEIFLAECNSAVLGLDSTDLLLHLLDLLLQFVDLGCLLPLVPLPLQEILKFLVVSQKQLLVLDYLLLDQLEFSNLLLEDLVAFDVVLFDLVDGGVLLLLQFLVDGH
jgi:hypothetical protein